MLKTILKNLVPLLLFWAALFAFLCNYYTPPVVVIPELRFFSTGQKYVPDSVGKQTLINKLTESFSDKIGAGLLEYNVFFENNFRLAFESEAAQPPLAYAYSILSVSSRGNRHEIMYQDNKLVTESVRKDEVFNLVDSVSIETQGQPQPKQMYSPSSLVKVSMVGNLIVSQGLNTYSKIHIGIFSFITILALINWVRQFMAFLILGPRKFFFETN